MTTTTLPRSLERYDGEATTRVDRYEWRPVEVAPPDAAAPDLRGRTVLVLGGRAGDRESVADRLRQAGASVRSGGYPGLGTGTGTGTGTDGGVDAGTDGRVDGIVDLGLDPAFALHDHARWRAALGETISALQAVYDDWAAETDATRCFYLTVTWLGGRMGYDRRHVAQPLGGVWAGIAKSLPHELPTCRVKVLDLDPADAADLAVLVARELADFDFYEVGWQGGARCTLGAQAAGCPPPRLDLAAQDVVLVSGGGRGVGFAFAERLAREVGCRVVVTGRSPVPDGEPWLRMPDDSYAELRRHRMREAGAGGIASVRRQHERWDAQREIAANLDRAHEQGLPIEYRVCDFLDLDAVRRLVDDLGPALRVVVHNAGIAAPTRLRGKSLDTVVRVVEAKLVTFTNLVEAVRGRDLDWFCNVGSVAGRMGGMAGQIDYAGANDVLSRLGFWAEEQLGLPVATLCWTTWDQVGLIANYEAALRYGSALRVDEGVTHWVRELRAAARTEAMFLGRVGTALAPTQIRGFLKFADHPDLPWLLSRQHYLGRVERYAPFRSVRSRVSLPPGSPCLADVALGGEPVLPVSVALEHAVAAGDWVPPEGWPVLHLTEIRDVAVDLPLLAQVARSGVLVKDATGGREDGDWTVHVTLATDDGRDVLRATLVYRLDPARPGSVVRPAAAGEAWLPASAMTWRGVAVRRPAWRATRDATGDVLVADVQPAAPADQWSVPSPPVCLLPTAGVEAVVQGALALAGTSPRVLLVERIALSASGEPEATVQGRPDDGTWLVADAEGRALLALTGVRLP